MTREQAITILSEKIKPCVLGEWGEATDMAIEALSAEQKEEELAKDIARRMATIIENEQDMRVILKNASAEPTVIRCRTLLTDEDFKMVAKQIRETNQNVIVIPCEAEVVSTETSTETSTNTSSGDLISRAEAHKVLSELSTEGGKDAKMLFMDAHEWIDAIPSADIPTKCIAQINIDADEVVQKIKGEYEIADRPSGEWVEKKSWWTKTQT